MRKVKYEKEVKKKVILYSVTAICPGFRHAWFDSNVGEIRKEIHHIKALVPKLTRFTR